MEQNILDNLNEFAFFPILSLLIFFVFFTVLLIWVLKMNKKLLKEMAEIPLNEINERIIEGEEL